MCAGSALSTSFLVTSSLACVCSSDAPSASARCRLGPPANCGCDKGLRAREGLGPLVGVPARVPERPDAEGGGCMTPALADHASFRCKSHRRAPNMASIMYAWKDLTVHGSPAETYISQRDQHSLAASHLLQQSSSYSKFGGPQEVRLLALGAFRQPCQVRQVQSHVNLPEPPLANLPICFLHNEQSKGNGGWAATACFAGFHALSQSNILLGIRKNQTIQNRQIKRCQKANGAQMVIKKGTCSLCSSTRLPQIMASCVRSLRSRLSSSSSFTALMPATN